MTLIALASILAAFALGRGTKRPVVVISRLPTRLERDELDVPAVWRRSPSQLAAHRAVFGANQRRPIIDVTEVSGG